MAGRQVLRILGLEHGDPEEGRSQHMFAFPFHPPPLPPHPAPSVPLFQGLFLDQTCPNYNKKRLFITSLGQVSFMKVNFVYIVYSVE